MSEPTKRDFSSASHSSTFSEGIARAVEFTLPYHSVSIIPEKPSEILKRNLSFRSVVSTSSNLVEQMNQVRIKIFEEFRIIGLGTCGTVFEVPGTKIAYKKGSNTVSMWNDFRLTNIVHNAILDVQDLFQEAFQNEIIPQTPLCYEFMFPESATWWNANLQKFPQSHRKEGVVFLVDMILSLPQQTREALIRMYFTQDKEMQDEYINHEENQHCLVRPYLGENETETH